MIEPTAFFRRVLGAALALVLAASVPATAQVTLFKQGVAEAAAGDAEIAAFYRETGYRPIWTGRDGDDEARLLALFAAFAGAGAHGLPAAKYDPAALRALLTGVEGQRALGRVEVELTRLFLGYARDVQTGLLTPSRVDEGLVRKVTLRDRGETLVAFARSAPGAFIDALPPQTPEYARLQKERLRLQRQLDRGGWGPEVRARKLEPGDAGPEVIALRNRLIAMGYLPRTARTGYDAALTEAVRAFQADHGLATDGVAGAGTLAAFNTPVETRLSQILVAMERERWLNHDLGDRHIWVNLTDFHVRIVDDGKTSFTTRSVVGMNATDRRSPEFSDEMDHLVINPTWHVPRSIATKEYLPQLQRDPYAQGQLMLVDRSGYIVPRDYVDFSQFDEETFPFDMKQPPSRSNALGLVKFMFPNRYNIYLHDTPAKSLFGREKRDFSHGCIRLQDPFDFAYALLARQTADPRGLFHGTLNTGRETRLDLAEPVPVHIVYRTAFGQAKGRMQYRGDVYGRDAKIFRALQDAGVELRAARS
ncbi:MAG: L,D-transpeptidase family protein [Paracoccaceae bacterium]|nr:L,D-transpeptidase family protein [Paracoccaceae bacterium]